MPERFSILWSVFNSYPPLTSEQTEAQRGQIICSRSHSWYMGVRVPSETFLINTPILQMGKLRLLRGRNLSHKQASSRLSLWLVELRRASCPKSPSVWAPQAHAMPVAT